MKLEIPRANQIKIILSFVVIAIIITAIVVSRKEIFHISNNTKDNERFFKEYPLTEVNNVFKYATADEALEILKSEKAIVYFGFSSCPWCQQYAPILNTVAKENDVDTIYYCDIREDRKNNTEAYKKLVDLLKGYLEDDTDGNKRIYVPDAYFVKDGKIVGHNNDTSTIEGADVEEYYTAEAKENLKNKLIELTKKAYPPECKDSEKGC